MSMNVLVKVCAVVGDDMVTTGGVVSSGTCQEATIWM